MKNSTLIKFNRRKLFFYLFSVFVLSGLNSPLYSQLAHKVTTDNQFGITLWNNGLLGNGFNRIEGDIIPSGLYDQFNGDPHKQVEHFSNVGVWIGGKIDGEPRVSTSIVDGVFDMGEEGFEFTPSSSFRIRSTNFSDPHFSIHAVSDEDFISTMTDNINTVPAHYPLGIKVRQSVYTWHHRQVSPEVIIQYTITNISSDLSNNPWTINDLYLGLWANASVGNMNYTSIYEPGGGYTWYDNLNGFDESLDANGYPRGIGYQFDVDGDNSWAQSYFGIKILGTDHPRNTWSSFYHQWVWTAASNYDYPDYVMPQDDQERYAFMHSSVPQGSSELYNGNGYPNDPNSWIFLVSGGPYGSTQTTNGMNLPPGDSVKITIALGAGFWASEEFVDNTERRANLVHHLDVAQQVYNGEDVNGDGALESGEDVVNPNGQIDRFIIPPYAPENLSANWQYPDVTLDWEQNSTNIDIIGYYVYKKTLEDSVIRMTTNPITDTHFVDNQVPDSGQTAYYVVGVNSIGMEGEHSDNVQDHSAVPNIEFTVGSNPQLGYPAPTDTAFTFQTRTFHWLATDPDGMETISQISYSLDDTTTWTSVPPSQNAVTLTDLSPGTHTFYLKCTDNYGMESPRIRFPDPDRQWDPVAWIVKEPIGQLLLIIEDNHGFGVDNDFYQSILRDSLGINNYSVWNLDQSANSVPYSQIDIENTMESFNQVWWITGDSNSSISEAIPALHHYLNDNGVLFINSVAPNPEVFDPLIPDSLSSEIIDPTGRFFAGTRMTSPIALYPPLETSTLIARRLRSIETNNNNILWYQLDQSDYYDGRPAVGILSDNQIKLGIFTVPLRYLDGTGNITQFYNTLLNETFPLDVQSDESSQLPETVQLLKNYPNPFNPRTTIRFEIPQRMEYSLSVYDVTGRKVKTLSHGQSTAGFHEVTWDGTNQADKQVSSGIYFYRLQAGKTIRVEKMMYLK